MYKRHETGKEGEMIAYEYLNRNFYRIICKNYRCKLGEIDIIAEEENELVFIEVKTRTGLGFGLPSDAVNRVKRSHIYNVAKYFLMQNKCENLYCRFDVIEVYIKEKEVKINHIKNCVFDKLYKKG